MKVASWTRTVDRSVGWLPTGWRLGWSFGYGVSWDGLGTNRFGRFFFSPFFCCWCPLRFFWGRKSRPENEDFEAKDMEVDGSDDFPDFN